MPALPWVKADSIYGEQSFSQTKKTKKKKQKKPTLESLAINGPPFYKYLLGIYAF